MMWKASTRNKSLRQDKSRNVRTVGDEERTRLFRKMISNRGMYDFVGQCASTRYGLNSKGLLHIAGAKP